jgi:hypothetical protein
MNSRHGIKTVMRDQLICNLDLACEKAKEEGIKLIRRYRDLSLYFH